MGHELIENKDKLALRESGAWHGLGVIFQGDKTPTEIAKEVFPFEVGSRWLYVNGNDGLEIIEGHKMNYRKDTGDNLGLVTDGYKIIQPWQMADFAEALARDGTIKVKVETAGSIQGGKRLWFLLKGEEFDVRSGDSVFPYVLLSNGYDGKSAFRVTPTTVRVVCSNTFHAVVPRFDKEDLMQSAIVIRHTANAMDKIEEAKKALAGYGQAIAATKQAFAALSAKEVNSEAVKQFFLESYTADFGPIPENPTDKAEANRRERALSALGNFSRRFDDEKGVAGTTAWNMANAYSGMVQHDLKARGKDDVARYENRVESNLFGLGSERSFAAFNRAFRMAVSS